MVERMVGIELEYSRVAWSGVVIGMVWFVGWKSRLALRGIVGMDFGLGSLLWGLVVWCRCERA